MNPGSNPQHQFVPAVPIITRHVEPIPWSIEAPTRWNITPAQRRLLERTYKTHPYPVMALREQLGRQLNVTPRQVQIWFQNRRQRSRKGHAEEVEDDEEEDLATLEAEAEQQTQEQAAKHQQAVYRYSQAAPPPPPPQGMVIAKPSAMDSHGRPTGMMPPADLGGSYGQGMPLLPPPPPPPHMGGLPHMGMNLPPSSGGHPGHSRYMHPPPPPQMGSSGHYSPHSLMPPMPLSSTPPPGPGGPGSSHGHNPPGHGQLMF